MLGLRVKVRMSDVPSVAASLNPPVELDALTAGEHPLVEVLPPRATVIFARVSSGEQAREGGSLTQQIESAMRLATQHGQKVHAIYVDPGASATKLTFDQRAGVRQLIEAIRQGKIGCVYTYKRDRIARVSAEWLAFFKISQKQKVSVLFSCPHEPPMGKGVYGKVQEAFMSLWAELEAEQIGIRVRDSLVSRFQRGEWVGGNLPYGLTRDPADQIVAHPTEGLVVQEVFRLALDEGMGPSAIAAKLNQEWPLSKRGLPWSGDAVKRVLQNRAYCGYTRLTTVVEGNDGPEQVSAERFTSTLPVLVPEDRWATLNAQRRERKRTSMARKPRHEESPNLLTGLVFCGYCQQALNSRLSLCKYTLQDGAPAEYRERICYCDSEDPCGSATISQELLLKHVLEAWLAMVNPLSQQELLHVIDAELADRRDRYQRRLVSERKALGQLKSALQRNRQALRGCADPKRAAFYQGRIRDLTNDRRLQERNLASLVSQHRQDDQSQALPQAVTPVELINRFGRAPLSLQRTFISTVVERISVNIVEQRLHVTFH